MTWFPRIRLRRFRLLLGAVALIAGATGFWMYQRSQDSKRIYRIGYVEAPPFMTRLPNGDVGGFALDAVNEAARRAGIRLQWIHCGQDGVNAVQSGQVDLWPLAVDWPGRRGDTYFTDPWLQTELHVLMRRGESLPGPYFTGSLGLKNSPVFIRQMHECFPASTSVFVVDYQEGIRALLDKQISGLLYTTWDSEPIEELLQNLDRTNGLRSVTVPGRTLQHVLVSSRAERQVAERLRQTLDGMARDGTLAAALLRHSWGGIAMLQTTYQLLAARQRARWLGWVSTSLLAGLLSMVILVWILHRTRVRVLASEAARSELLERYTLAARATNDVIWDWNPHAGSLVWSEGLKALSGFDPSEVPPDIHWRMARIHPEDRNQVTGSLQKILDAQDPRWSAEYRFLLKDGSAAFVVDRAHVIYDADGKPLRMIGAITDLTPRRHLETQLQLAQKMEAVGRLAGGVAHDFNNLLTVLRGYTDLLLDNMTEDSPQRRHASQISRVVDRASELVHQLLAFGRPQIIEPRIIDLNALLNEIEPLTRRLVGEDIELSLHLSTSACTVRADPGQLHQVIMNLVVNSRDAMPEGGRLILETAMVDIDEAQAGIHPGLSPGSHALLAITDTGIGISNEVLERIFEPFFTTKEQGKGTGLGLSTAYGIIHHCKGYISVYSEPGLGTTFKIYLPLMQGAEATSPEPLPAQALRPSGNEHILVAEDQEDVRVLTVKILELQGYRVSTANTSEGVLSLAENTPEPYDLLLTDVIMPGLNGKELAQHIQARWPDIKVLFMSGYSEDLIAHRGILNPDIAFLPKPFTREALLQKIREALTANEGDTGESS